MWGWFSFEASRASRTSRARAVSSALGGQDLQGHVALQPRVAGPIDFAHAARADGGKDLVQGRGERRTKGTSAVRRIVAPEASAPTDRVHPTRSAAGSPLLFSGCLARCSARIRHPWAWACSCSRGRALCGPSEQVLAAERSTRARRTRAGANRRALRIGAETAAGPHSRTRRVCGVLHLRYHATGSTRQRFAAGPARRAVAAAATTSSDSRGAA